MRKRLLNRRRSETFESERDGSRYRMTVGYYADGKVGEIFVNAARANSAILVSLCLQRGASLAEIRHALKRDARGLAASPIGAALDRVGAPMVVTDGS